MNDELLNNKNLESLVNFIFFKNLKINNNQKIFFDKIYKFFIFIY